MESLNKQLAKAKLAALEVLLHNTHGPFHGLPRTAGWGYPEPYTRDLMISSLGFMVSGDKKLIQSLRCVLETLAQNQSVHGHIPSLVHNREDRGASDTTPLFLIAAGFYRKASGETDFLDKAVQKALTWMSYQSPSDRYLIAQQPTTDWRDEQWVIGFGLYVNTLVYTYLQLHGEHTKAGLLRQQMSRFTISSDPQHRHVHEGFVVKYKPYYAFWSYKIYSSERFDLLGNSLAILSGLSSPSRSEEIIHFVETECENMRKNNLLVIDLPPNFFPYIKPEDPDWKPRYELYNKPGEYHNGGIWPFICGFYIAALVAAGKYRLAEKKLVALSELVSIPRNESLEFGFNEWFSALTGQPRGEDWQTWSAAMFLYAAKCVEEKKTPFFDKIRDAGNT